MRFVLVCLALFLSNALVSNVLLAQGVPPEEVQKDARKEAQEVTQVVTEEKVEQVVPKVESKVDSKVMRNENDEAVLQVGKHVGGNMDAMTMIISLLMVLVLIVIAAVVLKRFQPKRPGLAGLKIITSLHLGAKERLVVVQVADKQLLIGVTAQQITLLDSLDEPLDVGATLTGDIGQSVVSLFKKQMMKNK